MEASPSSEALDDLHSIGLERATDMAVMVQDRSQNGLKMAWSEYKSGDISHRDERDGQEWWCRALGDVERDLSLRSVGPPISGARFRKLGALRRHLGVYITFGLR